MRHPLDRCLAKIERARENTEALASAANAFLKRNPYDFVVKVGDNPGHYMICIEADEAPLNLSAIAGDVIYDLRSALDHLIWQLVIANGGKPGFHNQFPIHISKDDFAGKVGRPRRWRDGKMARADGPLTGVAPKAWALIERIQPYNRPHGEQSPDLNMLAILNRFSNTDKHKTLYGAIAFPRGSSVDIDSWIKWNPAATLISKQILITGTLAMEHDTEIARLVFDPNGAQPDVNVDAQFTANITIGDESMKRQRSDGGINAIQMPIQAFDTLRIRVSTTIRRFDPFF